MNIKRALVKIERTRILELVTFKRTTLIGHYPNHHQDQKKLILSGSDMNCTVSDLSMSIVHFGSFETVRTWLWRHFWSASSKIHILLVGKRIWIFELGDPDWRHGQVQTVFSVYILLSSSQFSRTNPTHICLHRSEQTDWTYWTDWTEEVVMECLWVIEINAEKCWEKEAIRTRLTDRVVWIPFWIFDLD